MCLAPNDFVHLHTHTEFSLLHRREPVACAFPSSGFARLAGKVGGQRRWSRLTPEERKAQMAHVREGQRRRYLDRAAAMAAERGLTPTAQQIERAADALRAADLAEYRLKAWQALRSTASTTDAGSTAPTTDAGGPS